MSDWSDLACNGVLRFDVVTVRTPHVRDFEQFVVSLSHRKDLPNAGARHKLRSCCFTLRVLAVGPFIIDHEHVHELHK